jgi:hypothetical protein
MKRVFIVHGWGGYPEEGWFPWLKTELEKEGFAVQVPAMPHTDEPTITDWVAHLASVVGTPDADTYFVGHSIGCQTILRYLAGINVPVGGTVCVAGFFELDNLADEDHRIARPWLDTPIDLAAIRRNCPRITAILSDDDPEVTLESSRAAFSEKLDARIIVEHAKGHFSASNDITELPSALQAVLDMSA